MSELNNEETFFVEGGLSVSGTLINSFTAGIKILLELGRSLGSVIRRGGSGQMCKIWQKEYVVIKEEYVYYF